jgi:hypothetical protein
MIIKQNMCATVHLEPNKNQKHVDFDVRAPEFIHVKGECDGAGFKQRLT